jgi:uncharacterized membrane protein
MAEYPVGDEPVRPSTGGALDALHALLGAFPVAYFTLAFITDIAYSRSTNLLWQYFSIWPIVAGLVMGALAILLGGIEWLVRRRRSAHGYGWHIILTIAAWLLALLDAFVHSRDGWTAVVPQGLILSGVVALLMLIAAGMSAVRWGRAR